MFLLRGGLELVLLRRKGLRHRDDGRTGLVEGQGRLRGVMGGGVLVGSSHEVLEERRDHRGSVVRRGQNAKLELLKLMEGVDGTHSVDAGRVGGGNEEDGVYSAAHGLCGRVWEEDGKEGGGDGVLHCAVALLALVCLRLMSASLLVGFDVFGFV